jgi:hypothetical protein
MIMQRIEIRSTDKTPEIIIDHSERYISMKGICAPANPHEFFEGFLQAVQQYKMNNEQLNLDIQLDYFNTGASKYLLHVFLELAKNDSRLKETVVNWTTDKGDQEIMEAGKMYEELTGLKFNYLEI